MHDPVTWYKITHAGEQVAQWDFQSNGCMVKVDWYGVKHAKKELGQYSAILTEQARLVTHIYCLQSLTDTPNILKQKRHVL